MDCRCINPNTSSEADFTITLRLNRSKYLKIIIFSHLNINSIRNKFENLKEVVSNYIDIRLRYPIETGLSDHHHLIYSILKSTFEKEEPKQVIYRNYKHFQWQHFENDLKSSLNNCNGNFDVYEKAFSSALNSHAPKKVKVLRGNHKPHLNKKLRKAIMERSRLKNKTNKLKQPTDIASYKKQ